MCTRLRLRSARLPTVRCSSVRGPALRCPSVVFVTADPSSRRAQFLFCPEICARRNFSVGYSRSRLFEFRYSTAVASRFSPAQFARPLTYFTSSHLSTHLAHPVRGVTLFWCMRRESPYLATLRRRHAGMLRQQCRFPGGAHFYSVLPFLRGIVNERSEHNGRFPLPDLCRIAAHQCGDSGRREIHLASPLSHVYYCPSRCMRFLRSPFARCNSA